MPIAIGRLLVLHAYGPWALSVRTTSVRECSGREDVTASCLGDGVPSSKQDTHDSQPSSG